MRHHLTDAQQKQVATLQQAVGAQQNLLNAYVQGVIDGIPDAPIGAQWRIDGAALVANEKPDIAPAEVEA